MGGSGVEFEMNCSSGIIPLPLPENAPEITLSSVSLFKSTVEAETLISSSFCEFSSSLENEGVKTISQLLHDPSSLSFDMFGGGNISEMVGSFGFVTEGHQSLFSYVPNLDAGGSEEGSISPPNDAKARLGCTNEKRRKLVLGADSFTPNRNAEDNLNVEPIEIVSEILNKDDKTPKAEHRNCADFHTKSDSKQPKGCSQSVQAPKENYVNVRARQRRATNSHSLAERVRREKISERMKLLQELVPGCNQIAGKTMVLDEIINYVQALQQQVEFLSMKLANVVADSNLDTERIVLSNILHARGEGVDGVLAIDSRLMTSHTTPHAMFQHHGTIPTMSKTSQPLSSLSKMER